MTTSQGSTDFGNPNPARDATTLDTVGTIDEVFLSPRILDRRAFDEYAHSLREIIKDASGEGQSLRNATTGVEQLRDGLRDATGELAKRLESAVKVLPTLEQHVKTAERLRQEVINPSLIADELRATIDKLLDEKSNEIQVRVNAIVDQACGTLDEHAARARRQSEELHSRSADALLRAQALLDQCDRLAARADDATLNMMATETRVQHGLADAESKAHAAASNVEHQTRQAIAEIDSRTTNAISNIETRAAQTLADGHNRTDAALQMISRRHDEAVGSINEASRAIGVQMQGLDRRAEDLANHTAMIAQQTHERLGATVNACEQTITPVVHRAQEAAKDLHDRTQSVTERLETLLAGDLGRVEQLCSRAEALLRDPAGLQGIVVKADQLRVDADHATREFDAIRLQAEQARKLLGEQLNTDAARIDDAESRRDKALQTTLQLGEQVQQIGAWLTAIITQAHETGKSLEQLAGKARRYGGS